VFEALIAPFAFAVIVVAIIVWAFIARARRRASRSAGESSPRSTSDRPRRYG
jgi:hypothetical protein